MGARRRILVVSMLVALAPGVSSADRTWRKEHVIPYDPEAKKKVVSGVVSPFDPASEAPGPFEIPFGSAWSDP